MTPEEILVRRGLLTAEQLRQATEQSMSGAVSLCDTLVGGGFVTAEELGWHVADANELPFVRVAADRVDLELAMRLGARFLRARRAVPLERVQGHVTFAIADVELAGSGPEFHDALDGRFDVSFAIAPDAQLRATLDALFGPASSTEAALQSIGDCAARTFHAHLVGAVRSGALMLRFDPTPRGLFVRIVDRRGARDVAELRVESAGPLAARARALLGGASRGRVSPRMCGRDVELDLDVVPTELGPATVCAISHATDSAARGNLAFDGLTAAADAALEGPALVVTAADPDLRRRLVAELLGACGARAQPLAVLDGATDVAGTEALLVRQVEDALALRVRAVVADCTDGSTSALLGLAARVPTLILLRHDVTGRAALALLPRDLRLLVRGALCPRGFVEAPSWT
jgi:hypothetical protein